MVTDDTASLPRLDAESVSASLFSALMKCSSFCMYGTCNKESNYFCSFVV